MSKTILLCSNVYPPNFIGGAELIAHYQAKAMQRLGHTPIIFAGESRELLPRHTLTPDTYEGLPVYRVQLMQEDFSTQYTNFFHPDIDRHFETVLDRHQPDVVHIHNMIGLSGGMIQAAKRRHAAVVVTLHDFWGFCLKNTLIKTGSEICRDFTRCSECQRTIGESGKELPIRMRNDYLAMQFRNIDCCFSPSQFVAETYIHAGVPVDKMRVVWNGIDVERFAKVVKEPAGGRVRFTFIGYLGEHKGIRTFLNALAMLRPIDRVRVNIVGDGHLRPELESWVQHHGLMDTVRFWGHVDHATIETVFRSTDVQVLPSIWPENQPVSITESMATRTPVIATGIGGVPELVKHGETGYLVEPGNEGELAKAMYRFLEDPKRIQAFGELAFQRVRENTFDNQARSIMRVYDEVCHAS